LSSIEIVAKQEFESSEEDIFSFIFEQKQYWLKKARATIPNRLQQFFYRFLSFELLIPSLYKIDKEALAFEIAKLEEFDKLGISVPTIVYKCEDFFVLEDCGRSVNRFFKDRKLKEDEFFVFVEKLLIELSKIHNLGFFHGGAQLRNFIYKDEKVFVIDLEESFDSSTTLDTLQFRDFLLFILSFTKLKKLSFEVDYRRIIDRYIELTNNKDIKTRLKKMGKKLSFFTYISELFFIKRFLGSDIVNFFKLFKLLNSLDG